MELQTLIEKWDEIKEIVTKETETSEIAYNTWLKPLDVYDIVDGTVYIIYSEDSESRMIALIEKKYKVIIKNVIKDITGNQYDIKIILPDEALRINSAKTNNVDLPTNNNSSYIGTSNYIDSNLNPKYTFNTFVVGRNNKFAQGTAYTVAEAPGEICNPLFICGGPGLGKTHLMHAIGNQIIENDNTKKVLYVTAEEFTNEVIECIKNSRNKSQQNDMTYFRDKYRNADVLMIDDIQFFVGKESSQDEFFNTFNKLHTSGKQIVISSDKMPNEIEGFEDRYITRFEQGITAEIKIPDYETRVAIIKNKMENKNAYFPDDVVDYIASNIKSNIRSIEGAINKLYAYSNLENTEITIDNAKDLLDSIISPEKPKEITPQLIIEVVCEHYGVTIEQLISKNRSQNIIRPRHVAMYLCTQETDCSQDTIAKLLDRKDHSTIINARDNIIEQLKTDKELQNQIETIKKKINTN